MKVVVLIVLTFVSSTVAIFRTHLTIPEEELVGKDVYVVGDVHGCYYELMELLDSISCINSSFAVLDPCVVILAGDTVNKGPYSLEVLRWIEDNWGKAYATAGNHEGNALDDWGEEEWTKDATDADKAFLESLPWTVTVPDETSQTVVVHAGLIPNLPTNQQEEFVMTRMRNLDNQDGEYIPYEEPEEGGENWAQVYSTDQTSELRFVVYGHDAGRGHDGVQEFGLTRGLETRCSKGGDLTAIKLPMQNNEYYVRENCPCYDDC